MWVGLSSNRDQLSHSFLWISHKSSEFQALAFAFDDAFAWDKKPGLMKGVEFGIDFKEPFVTPFKERVRRCSPAEELAKTKDGSKENEGSSGHPSFKEPMGK